MPKLGDGNQTYAEFIDREARSIYALSMAGTTVTVSSETARAVAREAMRVADADRLARQLAHQDFEETSDRLSRAILGWRFHVALSNDRKEVWTHLVLGALAYSTIQPPLLALLMALFA